MPSNIKNTLKTPEGYNKYWLKDDEWKEYQKLKKLRENGESLEYPQRKRLKELSSAVRYNELHNAQLTRELTFEEEKELKKVKKNIRDWLKGFTENKTLIKKYEFTYEEKKQMMKLRHKENRTPEETEKLHELRDKKTFTRHLERYREGTLSYDNSVEFVKLYNKYKTKWEIPNIDVKKLKVMPFEEEKDYFLKGNSGFNGKKINVQTKYKLTSEQEDELYELQVKRLFNEGKLLKADEKRLHELLNQREFNYLYSLRKQDGGLNFVQERRFRELYKRLKRKLKLNPKLLNSTVRPVQQRPLKTDETNFIRLTGNPEDGIPTQYSLDELFTQDPRRLSDLDKHIVQDWTNASFKQYREFLFDCEANPTLYREHLEREYGRPLTDREFGEELGSIVERCNRLMELCKNQTKKSMITWRGTVKNPVGFFIFQFF